jgi:hypothetical protein
VQKWVHLTLANGKTIDATEGHPFRTLEGWRDAILLKQGDMLILTGSDGKPSTIQVDGIRYETKVLTTYNLEVANAHTFFVGEDAVLVHNSRRSDGSYRRTKSGRFAKKPGPKCSKPTYTSSDRRREWKNEAENPTRDDFTEEDMERMRKGLPPQRYNADKGGIESMERSHEPIPLRDGGTQTVPRWPQEHAAVDPYRHTGY